MSDLLRVLDEIQARADDASDAAGTRSAVALWEEGRGHEVTPIVVWSYLAATLKDYDKLLIAARSDVLLLVAAFRVMVQEFDYYAEHGTEDEQDVIAAIRQGVVCFGRR